MKKKLIVLSGTILGFAPIVVLAETTGVTPRHSCAGGGLVTDVQGFLCKIGDILSAVIPILITLGVVYFVWGVIQYVIGTDAEQKASATNKIIYGIIGLAVIVAVWGLVNILVRTFVPQGNSSTITLPTVSY